MNILNITSRSITLEMENNSPYYSEYEFDIYVNGKILRKENRNVFTIYNLEPNKEYEIKTIDSIKIKTKEEQSIYLSKFNPHRDGIHDDTNFIQSAIMVTPKNGTLIIENGTYLVTSLYLKSDINIYFEKGAKILASTIRRNYPVHDISTEIGIWEGNETNNFASTFNFVNVDNVTLFGEGEIDGQALNGDWYENHRVQNIAWRGHSIFSANASNINVIGLFIHNTQSWAVHPYKSKNINFYNLTIENTPSMPTTDGIDPDMCDNVNIKGCNFSVGDDCIAIKSGTYELAKKYRLACSNITIENNLMSLGHGGVVFGSESSGGIYNVVVKKCIFKNTDRGLRIKTRRGRGSIGEIDNIVFDNIIMDNVLTPFVINSYYNMGPAGGHTEYVWTTKKLVVDEYTPILGKFHFSNMKCKNIEYAAGVFLGLPEMPIKEVSFDNVEFNYKEDAKEGKPCMMEHPYTMKKCGIYCLNVENLKLNNVKFDGQIGEEYIKEESK